MKVLLIGGAPNTGKTNAVAICAHYLINQSFTLLDCQDINGNKMQLPKIANGVNSPNDFLARLEGFDRNKKRVSVIITSASDTDVIIDNNLKYLQKQNCDIYVSSVRDIGPERKYLFTKFKFNTDNNGLIEFPLAKMSRKNQNWYTAKKWYDTTVKKMLETILGSNLFNI